MEARLQNDFAYTLDMKATGPDPLADFLFNVRAGHCEYFASAFVVLARIAGIPTREARRIESLGSGFKTTWKRVAPVGAAPLGVVPVGAVPFAGAAPSVGAAGATGFGGLIDATARTALARSASR